MNYDMPCKLTIETSMINAIKLYPLIHSKSYSEGNKFLERFYIEFHKPAHNQATLERSVYAPDNTWFSLFDEAEKVIMEDEYAFFGIMYESQVKLIKKRLEKLITKVQEEISAKGTYPPNNKYDYQSRRVFYLRDGLKDIEKTINLLSENDSISLTFIFAEWPALEEAKKREYVKEFEGKLMRIISQRDHTNDEIPF